MKAPGTHHSQFFPTLRYADPATAVLWLCKAFGFTEHFVARGDDGLVVHAQLRLGDGLLFLGPDRSDDPYRLHSPLVLNGLNQCVCVALHDVDAHCAAARAAGAVVITEPYDTAYGTREYSCRDPEGHVWCFGNYWGEP
jgi:uncharacterized glyoxalase superfamily protein PhnB